MVNAVADLLNLRDEIINGFPTEQHEKTSAMESFEEKSKTFFEQAERYNLTTRETHSHSSPGSPRKLLTNSDFISQELDRLCQIVAALKSQSPAHEPIPAPEQVKQDLFALKEQLQREEKIVSLLRIQETIKELVTKYETIKTQIETVIDGRGSVYNELVLATETLKQENDGDQKLREFCEQLKEIKALPQEYQVLINSSKKRLQQVESALTLLNEQDAKITALQQDLEGVSPAEITLSQSPGGTASAGIRSSSRARRNLFPEARLTGDERHSSKSNASLSAFSFHDSPQRTKHRRRRTSSAIHGSRRRTTFSHERIGDSANAELQMTSRLASSGNSVSLGYDSSESMGVEEESFRNRLISMFPSLSEAAQPVWDEELRRAQGDFTVFMTRQKRTPLRPRQVQEQIISALTLKYKLLRDLEPYDAQLHGDEPLSESEKTLLANLILKTIVKDLKHNIYVDELKSSSIHAESINAYLANSHQFLEQLTNQKLRAALLWRHLLCDIDAIIQRECEEFLQQKKGLLQRISDINAFSCKAKQHYAQVYPNRRRFVSGIIDNFVHMQQEDYERQYSDAEHFPFERAGVPAPLASFDTLAMVLHQTICQQVSLEKEQRLKIPAAQQGPQKSFWQRNQKTIVGALYSGVTGAIALGFGFGLGGPAGLLLMGLFGFGTFISKSFAVQGIIKTLQWLQIRNKVQQSRDRYRLVAGDKHSAESLSKNTGSSSHRPDQRSTHHKIHTQVGVPKIHSPRPRYARGNDDRDVPERTGSAPPTISRCPSRADLLQSSSRIEVGFQARDFPTSAYESESGGILSDVSSRSSFG